MRRAVRAMFLATALTTVMAGVALGKSGGIPAIPLNPQQEVAEVDSGGSGFFSYWIDGTDFCYTLTWEGLTAPATAAHVHWGPRNVAGPVVIPLLTTATTSGETSSCTTIASELAAAVSADPGAYYVNVHTSTYPPGEIRGQLK